MVVLPFFIYYHMRIIKTLNLGKGSYSHDQVDAVTNIKISRQFFFHKGSVSQLCSDRRGTALLTRAKS